MKMLRDLQDQACAIHGLIPPQSPAAKTRDWLCLGHFRIIDNPKSLDAVIERYLYRLQYVAGDVWMAYEDKLAAATEHSAWSTSELMENLWQVPAPRAGSLGEVLTRYQNRWREMEAAIENRAVLTYRDFSAFNGRGDTEERIEKTKTGRAMVRERARRELGKIQNYQTFESSRAGYERYLWTANPTLAIALSTPIPALVAEEERQTHSYVLSTTKTGKSELLKALCLNYISQHDGPGLVVLDPGGDMTAQMARWPEMIPTGRLAYIDPSLDQKQVPVINPFDNKGLSRRDRALLTGQIVAALGTLIEGRLGGALSIPMEALLYPSVRLLVDLPNTSLIDLRNLMRGDPRLLTLGRRSPNPQVADFFRSDFEKIADITKQSVLTKINNILNKGNLVELLCGPSTVNLEKLLNDRKFVLVNLAKGNLDPEEVSVLGTLLVAMVQAIAMRRVRMPESSRPQTHLIIDECQNFVTGELKTIIREARKFGLSVTLAQQELGAEMSDELRKAVIKTTNVKVIGRSAKDETRRTADLIDVPSDAVRECRAGEFFYQAGTYPAFKLYVRRDRLKTKGAITPVLWGQVKQQQLTYFYSPPALTDQSQKAKRNARDDRGDDAPGKPRSYKFD